MLEKKMSIVLHVVVWTILKNSRMTTHEVIRNLGNLFLDIIALGQTISDDGMEWNVSNEEVAFFQWSYSPSLENVVGIWFGFNEIFSSLSNDVLTYSFMA